MDKTSKEYISDILTDAEKIELERFASNENAFNAVAKVIFFGTYHNGTIEKGKKVDANMNWAIDPTLYKNKAVVTNEQMGQFLRGKYEAIAIVESAFSQINNFKPEVEVSEIEKPNPAR